MIQFLSSLFQNNNAVDNHARDFRWKGNFYIFFSSQLIIEPLLAINTTQTPLTNEDMMLHGIPMNHKQEHSYKKSYNA